MKKLKNTTTKEAFDCTFCDSEVYVGDEYYDNGEGDRLCVDCYEKFKPCRAFLQEDI